jgi:uncharacterized protein (DUF2342 family)
MSPASLADWTIAERVAVTVAGAGAPAVSAEEAGALRRSVHDAVRRADPLARRATGLGQDLPPAEAHVVSRRTWIRANVASLAWLTDPLAERLLRRSGTSRAVARRALGLQLGIVLGYLSTRVLGQYEVFLPDDRRARPAHARRPEPRPRRAHVAARGGGEPGGVPLGIVLHELAHRLQFEAVPGCAPPARPARHLPVRRPSFDPDRLREIAGRLPDAAPRARGSCATLSDSWSLVLTPCRRRRCSRPRHS